MIFTDLSSSEKNILICGSFLSKKVYYESFCKGALEK